MACSGSLLWQVHCPQAVAEKWPQSLTGGFSEASLHTGPRVVFFKIQSDHLEERAVSTAIVAGGLCFGKHICRFGYT